MRYLRLKKLRRWKTCQTPSATNASSVSTAKLVTRILVETGGRKDTVAGERHCALVRTGRSERIKVLTVGIRHPEFSLFEILHLVDDLVGDGLQLSHFRLQAAQTFLVCDGIVVDCIRTNVHIQIDGDCGYTRGAGFGEQGVFEADAKVGVRVRVDGEARFAFDVLLGQVDVVVFGTVDHFDVDALVGKVERFLGDRGRGDNDQRIGERIVPDALGVRVGRRGKVELDRTNKGGGEASQNQEQQACCRERCAQHYEHVTPYGGSACAVESGGRFRPGMNRSDHGVRRRETLANQLWEIACAVAMSPRQSLVRAVLSASYQRATGRTITERRSGWSRSMAVELRAGTCFAGSLALRACLRHHV